MKTRSTLRFLVICLLLMVAAPLWATDLLMVRSKLTFSSAQSRLEQEIRTLGYSISAAQRVDIDLVAVGFSAGNYRAISYGRLEEIQSLAERYPELTPFLPLQVVIFGERNTSLLVAVNPLYLKQFFTQPELADTFDRWNRDLELILERVRAAKR